MLWCSEVDRIRPLLPQENEIWQVTFAKKRLMAIVRGAYTYSNIIPST